MTFRVRPPQTIEAGDFRRLGQEAFGMPAGPPAAPPEPARLDQPGRHPLGVYQDEDGDEVLAGRAIDREFDSWFGGSLVPTCGVAGVTVAAEYRGRKLLDPLFAELLGRARRRGAVISTLHPTAPKIYRKFGYEVVSQFETARMPSWPLAQLRPDPEVPVRRARPADVEAIRAVYDHWAVGQDGPLSRRGPSFEATDEEFLAQFTGVSVAVDPEGGVCGYASWDRGSDWGPDATLKVTDLIATRGSAYASLLAAIGGHASVLGRVSFETSGLDLIRAFLPTAQWDVIEMTPYMLAIIDVPGALQARGYGSAVRAELTFRLRGAGFAAGDGLPESDGRYRLSLADGRGRCERQPGDDPDSPAEVTFTPQGLALAYAGVQSARSLRSAGLIRGPESQDGPVDSVFAGPPFQIKDHF